MKTWIYTSTFLTLPVFFMSLVYAAVGITYWTWQPSLQTLLFTGKFNNVAVAITGCLGVISISVIVVTMLNMAKYASKIDKLDEATDNYNKATEKMLRVRDLYTKKLSEL